jgi:hypothetical protein
MREDKEDLILQNKIVPSVLEGLFVIYNFKNKTTQPCPAT